MIGIDTNILVRFFIGDDIAQAHKVYEIFKQAEVERAELYVPILVIIELIWVFESVYKFERTEILQTLS
ncbi:PIN domain-containing protein, partial [Bathymodiolus thermophilus thioautotrophic gill symbiont]